MVPSLWEFLDAFKKFFFSPIMEVQDVFRSLEQLQQGRHPAAEYVMEFKLLTAQLTSPDLDFIRYSFLHSLELNLTKAVVNDIDKKDDR